MRSLLRRLSKTWIVFISYTLGVLTSVAVVSLVVLFVSTKYSLRQIEENTAFPTISDKYIGEYPEVYLRDMTLVQMLKEGKELADLGDELTLNFLISRYDLILSEEADIFLTPAVRDLPLEDVFSEDGFNIIMNAVYIGEFRGYEKIDGDDGEIDWYDPYKDEPVTGINRLVAGLTLAETLSGDFSFSTLFDELTFGEALGYKLVDGEYFDAAGNKVTGLIGVVCSSNVNNISNDINNLQLSEIFGYEKVDGVYYDENGKKVTGVMSVICDSTIKGVPDKINSAKFSDILGYQMDENGDYIDENGEKITGVMSVIADCTVTTAPDTIRDANMGEIMGYSFDSKAGIWVDSEGNAIHTLMNTISSKKIGDLNSLHEDLKISDVIPADERGDGAGYVSLLNPETPVNEISEEVNRVFKNNTMADFIDSGAITFENDASGEKAEKFKNSQFGEMTMDQMLGFISTNLIP